MEQRWGIRSKLSMLYSDGCAAESVGLIRTLLGRLWELFKDQYIKA